MLRWRVKMWVGGKYNRSINYDMSFIGIRRDNFVIIEANNADAASKFQGTILKEPSWLARMRRLGHVRFTSVMSVKLYHRR